MTIETVKKLRLADLMPTPTILEMADRSTIKLEGILGDLAVSIDSWDYPTDFVFYSLSDCWGTPIYLKNTVASYNKCIHQM